VSAFEEVLVAEHAVLAPELEGLGEVIDSLEEGEFPDELGFTLAELHHVELLVLALLEAGLLQVGQHAVLAVGLLHLEFQTYFFCLLQSAGTFA